jgi:two-component system, NtrC family, response regulator AtoC
MSIEKILIVDDELLVRNFLAETLRRKGLDVVTAENGQKALSILKDTIFDMVITDMKMPDITGIDVLKKVKEISPSTIVVVITAFGSIENAVEAMHFGAFNYLIKPFSPDAIEAIIEKAGEHVSLLEENQYLRQQVNAGGSRTYYQVIGESPVMKQIIANITQVAKSNASIFISGESGTGKEVIAHAIHYQSNRANKPFIKVNCAAVPDTLIESEFFGHEKGAFTGAHVQRPGRFQLANGGTLLLDEVTEIPITLQAKLLRVIQEHEFERVGGSKPVKVDVRLISTTNRDIKQAIEQKVLREDLYYRLNVVPVYIPPLRERPSDIIPLAEYFLKKLCQENHRPTKQLTPEARKKLLNYSWPGNVRELTNILERAVVMDASAMVAPEHLYLESTLSTMPTASSTAQLPQQEALPLGMTLQELEKRLIIETLQAHKNNRTKTAETLGISIRTLRNKLHDYGMITSDQSSRKLED